MARKAIAKNKRKAVLAEKQRDEAQAQNVTYNFQKLKGLRHS